jgi:hypothetical protein
MAGVTGDFVVVQLELFCPGGVDDTGKTGHRGGKQPPTDAGFKQGFVCRSNWLKLLLAKAAGPTISQPYRCLLSPSGADRTGQQPCFSAGLGCCRVKLAAEKQQ